MNSYSSIEQTGRRLPGNPIPGLKNDVQRTNSIGALALGLFMPLSPLGTDLDVKKTSQIGAPDFRGASA
jgi:hypothetical protein